MHTAVEDEASVTGSGTALVGRGDAARRYVEVGKRVPDGRSLGVHPAHPPFKRHPGTRRLALDREAARGPAAASVASVFARTYAPTGCRHTSLSGLDGDLDGPGGRRVGMWNVLFRPVPSGGAYYPAELYLVDRHGVALTPGVYHLDAVHHSLEVIQNGAPAIEFEDGVEPSAELVLVVACRPWKNRATYRDFGYRLSALDVGAVVGQIMVTWPDGGARADLLFEDRAANQMLGLDAEVESAYAVIGLPVKDQHLGRAATGRQASDQPRRPNVGLEPDRVMLRGLSPLLRQLHQSSQHVGAFAGELRRMTPAPSGALVSLPRGRPVDLAAGIARRRSAHALGRGSLGVEDLSRLLGAVMPGDPTAFGGVPPEAHLCVYLVLNSVEGLPRGSYRFVPERHALLPIRLADLRHELRAIAPATPPLSPSCSPGAVSIHLVGEYESGISAVGDRWYRMQNLLAGILVQRVYLAAASLGLGCRATLGYAVDELDRFLGLPASETTLIQLVLGRSEPTSGTYAQSWSLTL